jgi:hypothetical protein
MNPADDYGRNAAGHRTQPSNEQRTRAVGNPLPVGQIGRSSFSPSSEEMSPYGGVPGPGRSMHAAHNPPAAANLEGFSLQRTLIQAMPLVQKLLPLIDGNIATFLSNLLTPHPPAPPPAPPVNLEPIENNLVALRTQQRDLRNQIVEQNSTLKRVEDQLEMVREATDRNTLEQQELMEDLKAVGSRVNRLAALALLLLAASIVLNVMLYLHISRVLP